MLSTATAMAMGTLLRRAGAAAASGPAAAGAGRLALSRLASPSPHSFSSAAAGGNDFDVGDINREMEEVFGQTFEDASAAPGGADEPRPPPQWEQQQSLRGAGDQGQQGTTPGGSPRAAAPALTHVDAAGDYNMVDVSAKGDTHRVAEASATVRLEKHAFDLVAADKIKKGNVLSVAQIAGIQAAKKTPDLIPLCHPLFLSQVSVNLSLDAATSSVRISSTAKTTGKTGVEMEALTACSVAALTVYDMCKAASQKTRISDVKLVSKSKSPASDVA